MVEDNLDSTITAIQQELQRDPKWNQAINELSRYNLTSLSHNSQKVLEFFAYHYDSETNFQTQVSLEMWDRLVFSIEDVLTIFDKTGISKFITKYRERILEREFTEPTDFKNFEERLLSNLEIPNTAWREFWTIAEKSKKSVNEILYRDKQPGISKIWNGKYQTTLGPGKVKPLSPFKWGRAVAVGISSTLLLANGSLMLTSGGLGIVSVIPPIIVISYFSGQNSHT